MAKDPAFLFYPNDYLGGTMGMTFEEKGAYMELLMLQFNRGHMTSHMIGQTVGQLWDKIQDKFILDTNGLYYNIRLDEEKEKRKSFTDSRKNNKLGVNQYTKKGGHMTSHMENENENRIIYKELLLKVISENKILLPDGFDLLILEWLKYKSEKRQSYKETGLKTFINGFLRDSNSDLIIGRKMLDYSMGQNYDGLFMPKDSEKDSLKQKVKDYSTETLFN